MLRSRFTEFIMQDYLEKYCQVGPSLQLGLVLDSHLFYKCVFKTKTFLEIPVVPKIDINNIKKLFAEFRFQTCSQELASDGSQNLMLGYRTRIIKVLGHQLLMLGQIP